MSSHRSKLLILIVIFLFTTLSTFTWPVELLSITSDGYSGIARAFNSAAWFYMFCALVAPATLLTVVSVPQIPERRHIGQTLRLLFVILSVVAGLGIPATFVVTIGSSPQQNVCVNTARAIALFLQTLFYHQALSWIQKPDAASWNRRMWVYAVPVLVFAHWSLGSGVSAAVQAHYHAMGGAYCIADTNHPGRAYGEIDSLFDLRGVDMVVRRTGYKSTSRWYFHAILMVDHGHKISRWNWSGRNVMFEPLSERTTHLLIVPVENDCTPKTSFLWSLTGF